ncbi:MAG: enoyl-CoA hydratase/isomerase family protein [Comamonadaceae bacterium]|nr:enoyl-CoA hydratase/isomerase family protein [Comamonadaceae bacterium]
MPHFDFIQYERKGPVAWLTIHRPEVRNAINSQVMCELLTGIELAEDDEEVRAIVLTGAGDRAFCAGGDLQPSTQQFVRDFSRMDLPLVRLINKATQSSLPIVARVNGHVMAGGMALLSMADMAVAVDSARFGLPEVKIGMFPLQVDALLQRLIPRRKMVEMSLTGEPITADEALAIGLVNHIVPAAELDAKLDWLLSRLLDKSPTAVRLGKQSMEAVADMTLQQGLTFMAQQLGTMALTQDSKEGLAAFAEKRQPHWTNR